MKTFIKKILIVATLFLGMQLSASAMAEYSASSSSSTYCCEAKSTFGMGSCHVPSSCLSCECIGGAISATCKCLVSGVRVIPNLTTQNQADFTDFLLYLSNYGTSSMDQLHDDFQNVLNAVTSNNQTDFENYETAYRNTFVNTLSSNEKNDINNWVKGKGYPGF